MPIDTPHCFKILTLLHDSAVRTLRWALSIVRLKPVGAG
jgi:hypothetical protein